MLKVESAGITDTGRKRAGNEDSFFIDDSKCLYLVADGMGGHNAGEVASKLVVDRMAQMINKFISGDTDKIEMIRNASKEASWLISSILEANRAVYRLSMKESDYNGMGSTVSAVFVISDTLIASNVGDSPIYLIRNDEIKLLSVPHTAMAEYAAFAPADALPLSEKFRHTITRAMGIKNEVEPDFCEIKILNGDLVLLCSDGLSDKANPEEIMLIMQNNTPAEACRLLAGLANSRGGDDNITIIALKITDDLQAHTEHSSTITYQDDGSATQEIDNTYGVSGNFVVEYDTDDISNRALVEEITPEGLFIESGELFSIGQNIILTISDEKEEKSVMVNAKVIEIKPFGVKLEFVKLTPEEKKNIKSLIGK